MNIFLKTMMVMVCMVGTSSGMDFTPEPDPIIADFDFTCSPVELAGPATVAPEPYVLSYRTLWAINGSLDPEVQRSHLKAEHGLDPVAVDALSSKEVLAAHAAEHEGTLDVARFNEWFAYRGNINKPQNMTTFVSAPAVQQDCPSGNCPTVNFAPRRTVTRTRTVQVAPRMMVQSCPSGNCPTTYSTTRTMMRTRTPVRTSGRILGRVATAPFRLFRNRPRVFGRCR